MYTNARTHILCTYANINTHTIASTHIQTCSKILDAA